MLTFDDEEDNTGANHTSRSYDDRTKILPVRQEGETSVFSLNIWRKGLDWAVAGSSQERDDTIHRNRVGPPRRPRPPSRLVSMGRIEALYWLQQ